MKKMNKKGFTIVELVIVIAVIAILAAVMIPTFSGIVDKANSSAALQEARTKYTEVYADDIEDGAIDGTKKDGTDITAPSGETWTYDPESATAVFTYTKNGWTATFDGEEWDVAEAAQNNG